MIDWLTVAEVQVRQSRKNWRIGQFRPRATAQSAMNPEMLSIILFTALYGRSVPGPSREKRRRICTE